MYIYSAEKAKRVAQEDVVPRKELLAEGAFMRGGWGALMEEGLRFRRLPNEQECHRLTAEWKLGESMIESARSLASKELVRVSRLFSLLSEDNGKKLLYDYVENYRNFRRSGPFVGRRRYIPIHAYRKCRLSVSTQRENITGNIVSVSFH